MRAPKRPSGSRIPPSLAAESVVAADGPDLPARLQLLSLDPNLRGALRLRHLAQSGLVLCRAVAEADGAAVVPLIELDLEVASLPSRLSLVRMRMDNGRSLPRAVKIGQA